MRIQSNDITEETKERTVREEPNDLNELIAARGGEAWQFPDKLEVQMSYYRAGDDLVFAGTVTATATAACSRCLEPASLEVHRDLRIIFQPVGVSAGEGAADLPAYRDGDEIDLAQPIHEEILLCLPIQAICRDDCQGLCARCGVNRNESECRCDETWADPRWEALSKLRS